ncbi:hypothetical protein [Streptomyces sp. SID13031]|uniref:hypothetical protein n=1 Tax=Streptomyces sp. SID13031 TaxID=2706046 RepID=UPI0013C9C8E7|nr:hypothetical protein [Streptomyces sp. SID13031]NEA35879.1 hypothetical protein [Streptomyces sp. SID13031]
MAGRGLGRALLGSGLLAVTLLGGAGGYALGLVTTDQQASAGTPAAPLAVTVSPGGVPSTTPPPRKLVPDDSEPLRADEIRYRTRVFTVTSVVASRVSVRVPGNWEMILLDPPKDMKFNEPERRRAVRVQGGFTIARAPAVSLEARIKQFKALPADGMVSVKSHTVNPVTKDATLIYNYADIESNTLKYGMIRWVAGAKGLCILEIAVTGLPQDKAALADILDHASESATRTD